MNIRDQSHQVRVESAQRLGCGAFRHGFSEIITIIFRP
jgi:hypothetical protein